MVLTYQQAGVSIEAGNTLVRVKQRTLGMEHQLYSKVIQKWIDDRENIE